MKARFLALAALVLGMVSCQQDVELATPQGGEVDFQLKVDAVELSTRAGQDGAADTQAAHDSAFGAIDYLQATDVADAYRVDWTEVDLRYSLEVYDKAADYTNVVPVKDRQVVIVDKYEPVVFDLRLVPNREYHFVVFADFVADGEADKVVDSSIAYQAELGLRHNIGANLGDITIKEDAINDERGDAYFATKDITISNSAAQDIVLKRPYGKLRVIATDLAELNLNVDPAAVKVEYTAFHANKFNAVTGKIDGAYTEKAYTNVYNEISKKDVSKHVYNGYYESLTSENANNEVRHTHLTLFTDYILANPEQSTLHFTMSVYDDAAMADVNLIKATTFNTEIPVQRNYLTTIIGNVLTTATEVEVTIDDNFINPGVIHIENAWDGSSKAPQYDAATKTYFIEEASELAWFADQVNGTTRAAGNTFKGETFKLTKDINLNSERWTPIGATGKFEGTFDGNGKIIAGLMVSEEGTASAGLFATNRGLIKNLKVVGAEVYGHYKTAVIVGDGLCSRVEDCVVEDCVVVSTPYNNNDANNVGIITGYLSGEPTAYVKNCKVENCRVTAYRKVGGIVGAANAAAEVSGNTVSNTTVIADMTAEYSEVKPADAGAIVGYKAAEATVTKNTSSGVDVIIKVDNMTEVEDNNSSNNDIVHLTLDNGTYNLDQDLTVNGAIQANLGGEVIINANSNDIQAGTPYDYAFISNGDGNSLVINDADIVSKGGAVAAVNGAMVTFNGNKIFLNSASTSGRYLFYTEGAGSVITINGGEFSFSSTDNPRRAYVYASEGTTVYINGGTFGKASSKDGYKAGIMGSGNVVINGGTFGFDPTHWLSPDSIVEKVGNNWVVTGAQFIYSTDQLQEAISNAKAGQTLYLVNGDYVGHFDFTGKNLIVKGSNGAAYFKGMVWADQCNVTFQDVHFTNPDGVQHPNPTNSTYYTTVNNQYPLIGAYNNANVKFVNCTFHITGPTIYGFYGYAHNNPVFERCRFECNGIRPIANNGDSMTVTGCTFVDAYHYAVRIFENAGERQTVIFKDNKMEGTNTKGEFEGVNISKKGETATVFADFTISGNTADLKYRYHKDVTLDASCTGAELFEKEQ